MCVGTIANIEEAIENTERERRSTETGTRQAVRKIGDTVHVGYMSYAVWRTSWPDRLSDNEFLDERPDAAFLSVELTVRNNDKQARTIPPLTLVDENGAEYETSSKGWAVKDSIRSLHSLNPGVSKRCQADTGHRTLPTYPWPNSRQNNPGRNPGRAVHARHPRPVQRKGGAPSRDRRRL